MNIKLLLLFPLLLIINSSFAQNWQPISTTKLTNFRDNTPLISQSILSVPNLTTEVMNQPISSLFVDTVILDGLDSVFYFCKRAYSLQGSYNVYKNQPHFLQDKMLTSTNGIYRFYSPDSFSIHSQANINDSWFFSQSQQDTATISTVYQGLVFGQLDSVKVISLSSGDSILLSKNYGIIYFSSSFTNTYDLIGIEALDYSTSIGVSMPNSHDIYDYEVGDIFVHRSILQSQSWYTPIDHYKYRIASKNQSPTGVTYTVDFAETHDSGGPNPITRDSGTTTWTFNYPHSSVDEHNGIGMDINPAGNENYKMYSVYEDGNGLFYKAMESHLLDTTTTPNVFYSLNGKLRSRIYAPGFGKISDYYLYAGGSTFNSKLIAYYKNGIVQGDTSIGVNFLIPLPTSKVQEEAVSMTITPNPANDFIVLNFEGKKFNYGLINVRILNIRGQEIKSSSYPSNKTITLDVNGLVDGVYFVEVNAPPIKSIKKIVISRN